MPVGSRWRCGFIVTQGPDHHQSRQLSARPGPRSRGSRRSADPTQDELGAAIVIMPGRPAAMLEHESGVGAQRVEIARCALPDQDAGVVPLLTQLVVDETWVAVAVAHGVPEPAARFTLSMLQATRSGYFTHSDPALAQPVTLPHRLSI